MMAAALKPDPMLGPERPQVSRVAVYPVPPLNDPPEGVAAVAAWGEGRDGSSVALGPAGRGRALVAARSGVPVGPRRIVQPFLKLVTYVPPEHLEAVRQALDGAGAGAIGRYSGCTFAARGEGTFLPEAGATPFVGTVGRLERVEEFRLETLVPRWWKERAEAALLAAHPYEEVAYDWIPLENTVAYPRMVEDDSGVIFTDVLDPPAVHWIRRRRPRRVFCELADTRDRWMLAEDGIEVVVEPLGRFLVPGVEALLAQAESTPKEWSRP